MRLEIDWEWRSSSPPEPAWAGPAKWNAFANKRGLPSIRGYDAAPHVAVVGNTLVFGSSIDHAIRRLDTATGKETAGFYGCNGPVRGAPSVSDGNIYFGCDDGYAYCLDATDCSLLWKYRPVDDNRLVLNNGRPISFWPCRTGVVVHEGTAYFAASMLPWKESYLCAVDAKTGGLDGEGRYVHKLSGMTFEGAPAISEQALIFPQGRVAPLVFDCATGKGIGKLPGGGGSLVVVTTDGKILHGPGMDSRRGAIGASNAKTREKIAAFNQGTSIVAGNSSVYVVTETELVAFNLAGNKQQWKVKASHPYSLILASETLYAGGQDEVAAFDAKDGTRLWTHPVVGKAHGLAVSGGRLFVSTDAGRIVAFRPGAKQSDISEQPKQDQAAAVALDDTKKDAPAKLAAGPWVQFESPEVALVRWHTSKPMPTILDYSLDGRVKHDGGPAIRANDSAVRVAGPVVRVEDSAAKTVHMARLTGLRNRRVYSYTIQTTIDGSTAKTAAWELDTLFNFASSQPLAEMTGFGGEKTAEYILAQTKIDRGICLLLGSDQGQLAYELARQSKLRVIGVDTDSARVAAARLRLSRAGAASSRVTLLHVDSYDDLPLPSNFANLVVSDAIVTDPKSIEEATRLACPAGGVVFLKRSGKPGPGGEWTHVLRDPLPGTGQWTHQYGAANNSAYGGESLAGATGASDFEVQWIGRPGPRFKPDRNGRKPSPLAAGGRLFIQGMQRIAALDAYNGTPLWALEIPGLERFNMPRDCGNWCTDGNHLYAAVHGRCLKIDAAGGDVRALFDVVPGPNKEWPHDWGFIATQGDRVVGSAVKQDTSWTNFWGGGGAGWYDFSSGAVTDKVCSENLFSLSKSSGKVVWTYTGGVIINSTITMGEGRIYFVESRNQKAKDNESRRLGSPEFWQDQYLVAFDADTGRQLYQRPIDTLDGNVMFSLAYGQEKLALVSSGGSSYHVYVFGAPDGRPVWDKPLKWHSDNHGGHMARPAIVDDLLFVKPHAMQLATGEALPKKISVGRGCGTYVCTTGSLIFRANSVAMWDRKTGKTSTWARLRPDCWLSTIPASGMLLSPEGGGGCSCGGWMETSVGFMPVAEK